MSEIFEQAVQFTLKHEGGYVNDPVDPGGETKYGISKKSYPDIDIKNLTKEQAKAIYYQDYWMESGCDSMPPKTAVAVFDSSVNVGVGRVKGWLAGIDKNDDTTMAGYILDRRESYYKTLVSTNPALSKFLKGWTNRVRDLRNFINGSIPVSKTFPILIVGTISVGVWMWYRSRKRKYRYT